MSSKLGLVFPGGLMVIIRSTHPLNVLMNMLEANKTPEQYHFYIDVRHGTVVTIIYSCLNVFANKLQSENICHKGFIKSCPNFKNFNGVPCFSLLKLESGLKIHVRNVA